MIDNVLAGQNIAAHRQNKGWTQGELAQRLNVTHQAVSKWENGVAFPDICTLLDLSRLFGVTMEQLLTGEHAAPENDSPLTGYASGVCTQPEPSVGDPTEADAQQAPSQTDSEAENAPDSNASSDSYNWDEIISLAPFASRETLDRLVDTCIENCSLEHITMLAPFLSRQTLDRLADKTISDKDWAGYLSALAPFLSRQTLDRLINLHMDGALPHDQFVALAPFLGHDTLDRLIRASRDKPDWNEIVSLAPFASRDTLNWLISQCDTPCDRRYLSALAPFLDRRTLDQLILGESLRKSPDKSATWAEVHEREKEKAERRLASYAPFLDADPEEKAVSERVSCAERRTKIVPAQPQADNLEEYADQILSMLHEVCEANDPVVEHFSEIRSAILMQDYASLNEFAPLLDEHIGPQWLEEYAELSAHTEPDEEFIHQLDVALAQRDWNWIEDHAHLISDSEMIRRIVLVSTTEGYFDFVPLFIDQLDQHAIDSAARQAIRQGRPDDILSFADRVSQGIL